MKIALVVLCLAVLAVVGYFLRSNAVEKSIWRELSLQVPAQALTPAETRITSDAVSDGNTSGSDQIGHVRLGNGDVWRFAFRSHHAVNGPDSFSVFAGPLGTFRVRGDAFCCEVQFPESATKDSAEFLAFLRRTNGSVEAVK